MSAAAFDTYTAAKRLRDAGFDERQTEAAVSMVRDAVGSDRENLATKSDIADLRAELATKADLRDALSGIRWVIGLLAAFMFAIGLRVFGVL